MNKLTLAVFSVFLLIVSVVAFGCAQQPASPAPASTSSSSSASPSSSAPASASSSSPASTSSSSNVAVQPPSNAAAFEKAKANFEKIEAAARKEGKVTVYGGFEPVALDAIQKEWGSKYPEIKLEVLDARSAELMARLETEQASKNFVVDVWNGSTQSNWVLKDRGTVVSIDMLGSLPTLSDPNAKWFNKPFMDPDGTYLYSLYGGAWGIIINTKLVPSDKEPKSWADLTDPYWKGKMLQDHPGGVRAGGTWYLLTSYHFGESYVDKMAKQGSKIGEIAAANAAKQVATGEYPLQFPAGAQVVAEMPADAPVKFIFPEEGWMALPNAFSVVKNAPHPNAALVFTEFILSKEGQTAVAKSGRYISRADVPLPYPKLQDVSKAKMLPLFPADWMLKNQDRLYEEARKRYNLN